MPHATTQPTTELGVRLEKERDRRGLGMQEMADWIGVTKPTYLGWLRGVQPQPHHQKLIAKKLNTKPTTVAGWVMMGTLLYITWKEGVPVIIEPERRSNDLYALISDTDSLRPAA